MKKLLTISLVLLFAGSAFGENPPLEIGDLIDYPDPTIQYTGGTSVPDNTLGLTAYGVYAVLGLSGVEFYRDAPWDPGNPAVYLGESHISDGGSSYSWYGMVDWPPGTYTYMARAVGFETPVLYSDWAYTTGTVVPEPATLAVLALGGLAALIRRH